MITNRTNSTNESTPGFISFCKKDFTTLTNAGWFRKDDVIILTVSHIIISIAIITTNVMLLRTMFPQRHKNIINKLFLLLSLTDLCVGFVTPIQIIRFLVSDRILSCKLSPLDTFFAAFLHPIQLY